MRRYRILGLDFDTRATLLSMKPSVPPNALAEENRARILQGLVEEYGAWASDVKLANFLELGPAPFSLLAFHNVFFRQARSAFVIGAYYPALAATCALGERVLNHLVLTLREDFTSTREYREMSRKQSFDKWDRVINALAAWDVLLPRTVALFRKLKELRTGAIHFRAETERATRAHALDALNVFRDIVVAQFSALGEDLPWYFMANGAIFVRKQSEAQPFVRRIVLPNCRLVGPDHLLSMDTRGAWQVNDRSPDDDREVSDEEFGELFAAAMKIASNPNAP